MVLGAADKRIRVLLAPLAFFVVVFAILPFAYLVWLSLTDLDFATNAVNPSYVGAANYWSALVSERLFQSSVVTTSFVVSCLVIEVGLGLLVASLLYLNEDKLTNALPLIATPLLLAPVTVGLIWRMLLHDDYGPIGNVLLASGFLESSLLGTPIYAFFALVAVDAWQWTPFFILLLYIAIQRIEPGLFRQARLDGAGTWQIVTDVVVPLIKPVLLVSILVRAIDLSKEFDKTIQITRGGPGSSSEFLSILTWRIGFERGEIGYASAIAVVAYIALLILALLALRKNR